MWNFDNLVPGGSVSKPACILQEPVVWRRRKTHTRQNWFSLMWTKVNCFLFVGDSPQSQTLTTEKRHFIKLRQGHVGSFISDSTASGLFLVSLHTRQAGREKDADKKSEEFVTKEKKNQVHCLSHSGKFTVWVFTTNTGCQTGGVIKYVALWLTPSVCKASVLTATLTVTNFVTFYFYKFFLCMYNNKSHSSTSSDVSQCSSQLLKYDSEIH